MNNLDLLAEAAEYVERVGLTSIGAAAKDEPVFGVDGQQSFRGASSWPTNSEWLAGSSGPIRKQQAASINNSRTAHNVMEKNRRAYLRWCMDCLRNELPIADGQRCTTLWILAKARRYIESLERDSMRLHQERTALQNANKLVRSRLRSFSFSDDFAAQADVSPAASSNDIPQATAAFARIQLLPNSTSVSPNQPVRGPSPNGTSVKQGSSVTVASQLRPTALSRRRCVTLNGDYVDYIPTPRGGAEFAMPVRNVKYQAAPATIGAGGAYRLRPKKRNVSTPNGGGRITPPTLVSIPTANGERRLVSVLKPLAGGQPPVKAMAQSFAAPSGSYLNAPFRARSMTTVALARSQSEVANSADTDGVDSESAVFADGDVDMVDVSGSTLECAYTAESSPSGGEGLCGVIEIEVTSGMEPQPAVLVIENDDNSSNDSGVIANS